MLAPNARNAKFYKTGNTPLPDRGVDGAKLETWWRAMVGTYERYRLLRDQPPEHEHTEGFCAGCRARRYSFKVEMKQAETMLGLVHGLIAPETELICNAQCPHLNRGLMPVDVKRLLDTLTRDIQETKEYLSHNWAEWAEDELYSTKATLKAFEEMLASGGAPA